MRLADQAPVDLLHRRRAPGLDRPVDRVELRDVRIQRGRRLCCISALERNVSGSSTKLTAPISVSRWRASTATPFESDANAAAEQRRHEYQQQHAADAAGVVRAEREREQHDQRPSGSRS